MEQTNNTNDFWDDINLDILRMAADGATNEEIAEKVCRGTDCLEKRRTAIFKELEAKNITQAVANPLRTIRID